MEGLGSLVEVVPLITHQFHDFCAKVIENISLFSGFMATVMDHESFNIAPRLCIWEYIQRTSGAVSNQLIYVRIEHSSRSS